MPQAVCMRSRQFIRSRTVSQRPHGYHGRQGDFAPWSPAHYRARSGVLAIGQAETRLVTTVPHALNTQAIQVDPAPRACCSLEAQAGPTGSSGFAVSATTLGIVGAPTYVYRADAIRHHGAEALPALVGTATRFSGRLVDALPAHALLAVARAVFAAECLDTQCLGCIASRGS